MSTKKFKFFYQLESIDCGPACLKMICHYHGRVLGMNHLRQVCHASRVGVSLAGIQKGAESLGFDTLALALTPDELKQHDIPLPCVIHWKESHFVVLVNVRDRDNRRKYLIADPAFGIIRMEEERFFNAWKGSNAEGIILALEPRERFFDTPLSKDDMAGDSPNKYLFGYAKRFSSSLTRLFLILILAGALNLAIPILTQKLVDQGIAYQNIQLVYLVIISQFLIFIGIALLDLFKGWVLLYANTRISITMISDFLNKLFHLPIHYFDSKWVGDLIQRIGDNRRIEGFLTNSLIGILFSIMNFIVFSFILFYYHPLILFIFFIGSALSVIWIILFLRKRRILDYNKFEASAENTDNLIETITAMPEIKLSNAEDIKRWQWEKIQAKLFHINERALRLEQYQYLGSGFVTQLKNLLISFFVAQQVIDGRLSLGMMLSISYIIGQLNGPLSQLIDFFQTGQDAKVSLDRLKEVHGRKEEDEETSQSADVSTIVSAASQLNGRNDRLSTAANDKRQQRHFPPMEGFGALDIDAIRFGYSGFEDDLLFDGLTMSIPEGKVTAIVGPSGSGKTTLLKLMLKFYPLQGGAIHFGNTLLWLINAKYWRSHCGVVMQEGHIFSDTVARNIAMSTEEIDYDRVLFSAKLANIDDFARELPKKYETRIGNTGIGLSKGQKQRILIARAIYKNPKLIFLDEATSSLDANNEKVIHENLAHFFERRTVVIIAHRLSTVKNADQIIVLEQGKITESGNHTSLTRNRGVYYHLVKNQLELGD
jgi:ATP-binding cassette subfamily B protein